ncbi:MAG: gliding motility-associated C-terminal domain-containing protein [Crocinitomicaceae bacterium]|nr:gliding motility-associated C-terminal domain-containing protein [Crocinitomicaceae bacterium]
MNRFFKIVFFFLSLSGVNAFAQPEWVQQNSGVTSYLLDIEFINENIGYCVGMDGVILKTIDGGTTWTPQNSGTLFDLWDAHFYDELTGWVCGQSGVILKTINGGANWSVVSLGTPFEFHQINMLGSIAGLVGGKNTSTGYAVIYYTTDGGANWYPYSAPGLLYDILDIEFINGTTGFAMDYFDIYYTETSGSAWTPVSIPTTAQMNRIEMFDGNKGWMCGANGTVLFTSDGGTNWVQQSTPVTTTLWGITIADLNNVFISGADGTIISTSNGGTTWIQNTTGIDDTLPSISSADAYHVWSCGTDGKILRLAPETDLELISYNGPNSSCPGTPFYISIGIKNVGQAPITNGTFTVLNGITPVLTYDYSGNLLPGNDEIINIGQVSINSTSILTINYSGDDITTNNSLLQPVALYSDQEYGTTSPVYVCAGGIASFHAYGGSSYYWFNASEDSTAQYQNIEVYNDQNFIVQIKQSTCTITDTVQVIIDNGDCKTTAFSPNGDGKNDFLYIENLPSSENTVFIFNRWGDQIIQIANYDNYSVYWDGKDASDKSVAEGVYYYTVETPSQGPVLHGWVQILR